jgi:Domain of unknown function (DUF4411)
MPDIWVIDTCSVIEIRRTSLQIPRAKQPAIYRALTALVTEGILVYPRQVLAELERQTSTIKAKGQIDLAYEWAHQNAEEACKHATDYRALRDALAVEGVEDLLDSDKAGGVEPADPYVLGLAHQLRGSHEPCVITEDRKNAPDKIGLASAVGLVGIPVVPIRAFLRNRNIWRVPSGAT